MEESRFPEDTVFSFVQEISQILWLSSICYGVNNIPELLAIRKQMCLVHTEPSHFFRSGLFVSSHVVHAVLFVQAFQSDRSMHCYKSKQHFKNSNYLK